MWIIFLLEQIKLAVVERLLLVQAHCSTCEFVNVER